jgi:hypothetical protein
MAELITLRGGQQTEDRRLDALRPSDERHLEGYPMGALAAEERPEDVPVVVGIPWLASFDDPVPMRERGRTIYVVKMASNLGAERGGHCICLEPASISDAVSWWEFYDQGQQGACVGFGWSRAMSLLNRKRYDARWLYLEAQRGDEWPGGEYPGATPVYGGTSVRAGADVLRAQGHRIMRGGKSLGPDATQGISANRWLAHAQEVLEALGTPTLDYVEVLNSWGRQGYPHRVRFDAAVIDYVLANTWGEATAPTDR